MALDWELTANAVRLFHFARVAKRIRCALMLIVQENGKLRSYGLALRRHRLPEQVILHLLRHITTYPNNGLA